MHGVLLRANRKAIVRMTALVQRMIEESGDPIGFDARTWVEGWLFQVNPALGGQLPIAVMAQPEGEAILCTLLLRAQSSTYS